MQKSDYKQKTIMNIALTFDATYADHAAVTISTVLNHADSACQFVVFWLVTHTDVTQQTKQNIKRAFSSIAVINFLSVDDVLEHLPLSTHNSASYISRAMYLRLYIPSILLTRVKRLLYLDCDILCTNSLVDLFHVDMQGHPVGAVRDAHTRRLIDKGGIPGLFDYQHINPQALYFNSGVLLIDVESWVREEIAERAFAYVQKHANEARFPDQDALNFALYNNWYRLNKKWNYMWPWRLESRAGLNTASAAVIHSTGPLKHWNHDYPVDQCRKIYFDNLEAFYTKLV